MEVDACMKQLLELQQQKDRGCRWIGEKQLGRLEHFFELEMVAEFGELEIPRFLRYVSDNYSVVFWWKWHVNDVHRFLFIKSQVRGLVISFFEELQTSSSLTLALLFPHAAK